MRFVLQQDGSYLDTASSDGALLTRGELEKLKLDHEQSPTAANAEVQALIADINETLAT